MADAYEVEKKTEGRKWAEGGFESRGEALESLAEWVSEGRSIGETRTGRIVKVSV